MKNKYIKYGGILLAIVIAFFVYRFANDRQVFARMDRGGVGDFPVSERQYNAYLKYIEDRDKADNFGSTTPEGTLELFVEALKKEDVSLATKYFVPEKQEKMEDDLMAGLKSGGVNSLISDLSKEKTKGVLSDTRVRFETYDQNAMAEFSFDLRLNKFTQKWKIESL